MQVLLSMVVYVMICTITIGLQAVAVAMSDPFGSDDLDFDLASSSRLYKQAAKRVDPQKSKGLRKRLEQRGQNRKSLA